MKSSQATPQSRYLNTLQRHSPLSSPPSNPKNPKDNPKNPKKSTKKSKSISARENKKLDNLEMSKNREIVVQEEQKGDVQVEEIECDLCGEFAAKW